MGCIDEHALSVAAVARTMGLARQSVQRTADILVQEGLAEYRENPEHRRAKLVVLTAHGLHALRDIEARQNKWANQLGAALNTVELAAACRVLDTLSGLLQDPGEV